MIKFLDILSFILTLLYGGVFFFMFQSILPMRKPLLLKVIGCILLLFISDTSVYSNDLVQILAPMLGMFLYLLVFHQGRLLGKLSMLLIFYPVMIAINYLMHDIGLRFFKYTTGWEYVSTVGWTHEKLFISTLIHTLSVLIRLLFWIGAWRLLRKYLEQIQNHLTTKMWLITDLMNLAAFVAIFTIIYCMPEEALIIYPICCAAIFTSLGSIYLASYICGSIQTAYYAQMLEKKHSYYEEQLKEEARICSIYHDLKNHLLVLQAQEQQGSLQSKQSIDLLQEQISDYENYQHTGNDFLDMVIREKARIAQEKKIDFSASLLMEDSSFMEQLDISTIMGNTLDNAIEACEKLPEEERLITVKGSRVRDMLVITAKNPAINDISITEQTSKKDTLLHGFGLTNIKKAVEKYEGQCSIKVEKGNFLLNIIIPIPEAS